MLATNVFTGITLFSVLMFHAHAKGGNLDPCRMSSDCATSRTCRVFKLDIGKAILQVFGKGIDLGNIITSITPTCNANDNYCMCLPSSDNAFKCSTSSSCLRGEVCTSERYCISEMQQRWFQEARKCISNSACGSNQQCAKFVLDAAGFCLARMGTSNIGNGTSNPDSNSTNTDGNGGQAQDVCISANYLSHIPAHKLLYKNHITARVLCDSYGSCATAGHIVRYRGKAMMMKSYCAMAGSCKTKIMPVNSPRYHRALAIPSNTTDMSFTAFAARHGTKTEEYILRAAVHMGL